MCILIIKPAGVELPDIKTLRNCHDNNPHGMGFATPERIYRTLDFNKFVRAIAKCDPTQPMIIHFRYATHGSVCQNNCHPFYDPDARCAFAHNGVLPIDPIGDMTDSETAFRLDFAPAIARHGIYSPELKQTVNTIRGASKFAFLTDRGQIRAFGKFVEHDGCYYSNHTYLYSRRRWHMAAT